MTYAALFLALIATTPSADDAPASLSAIGARGEPVLLDFNATWCGPCRQMRKAIDGLVDAGYPIKSIDVDKEAELARKYRVKAYPTFIVVDEDGKTLARSEGLQPAADLAAMYREAQGKVRSRPQARPISDQRDDDAMSGTANDQGVEEAVPKRGKTPNPHPWETVVRIKIKLAGNAEGVGSGTIISSNAQESIILTCAHIFKEDGRPTPRPSQFRKAINVDLFDGQRGGPKHNQVHYVETVVGEAIDYDLTNDVGLIRIRPGKVLPFAKVVPATWTVKEGMSMTTVGCSEGKDATAWSTTVLRTMARLKNMGTGESFFVTECEFPPTQGRSGGGLFTDNGYVAGVCDFADPQHGHGLYAVPQSIHKMLDKNRMTALYEPAVRNRDEPKPMLADSGAKPSRGSYRGQSPEEELTIPPPSRFGIKPPVVADADREELAPQVSKAWAAPDSKLASRQQLGTKAIPSRMTQESDDVTAVNPAPAAPAEEVIPEDKPLPKNHNWKPVRNR